MEEKLERKAVNNNGVEIEYYVSNQVNEKSTLVISMGIWEPAQRAFPLISRLLGRHCIVLSYRGRGNSSTPASGYNWDHHMSDLACVLKNEPIHKPVFLGFSKGVSYMLGYLSTNLEIAKGLIIIDYPAIHSKLEKGAAKFWGNLSYNGNRLDNYIDTHALEGIEEESTYKEFYPVFQDINCPVWLFRGTDMQSDIPSNLTEEDISKYKSYVNIFEIIDFNYSGHMILDEELGKAARQIKRILDSIE
ncbi:MAG: alpha/beta hydrolase [Mobilitalea sp.]